MVTIGVGDKLIIDEHQALTDVPCPRGGYSVMGMESAASISSLGDKVIGTIPVEVNITASDSYVALNSPQFVSIDEGKKFYVRVRNASGAVLFSNVIIKPVNIVDIPVVSMALGRTIEVTYA